MTSSCISNTPKLRFSSARFRSSAFEPSSSTALPFLYHTGTILRHYVTNVRGEQHVSLSLSDASRSNAKRRFRIHNYQSPTSPTRVRRHLVASCNALGLKTLEALSSNHIRERIIFDDGQRRTVYSKSADEEQPFSRSAYNEPELGENLDRHQTPHQYGENDIKDIKSGKTAGGKNFVSEHSVEGVGPEPEFESDMNPSAALDGEHRGPSEAEGDAHPSWNRRKAYSLYPSLSGRAQSTGMDNRRQPSFPRKEESPTSSSSASRRLAKRPSHARHSEGEDYVPFEGIANATVPKGSTITQSEFKAFEKLFEESIQKGSFSDEAFTMERLFDDLAKPPVLPPNKTVDIVTDADSPRGGPANNTATIRLINPGDPLDGRFSNRTRRFRELRLLIDSAKTDQELWQIMHEKIFVPLKALELGNPAVNAERERRRVNIHQTNLERSKKFATGREDSFSKVEFDEDSLDTWAAIVPQLMVHIIKNLTEYFPTSSLGLAVLPALKQVGPNEFALGASTTLYNRHMRLLFERVNDLPGVCRTLEEMDRAVFSFNRSTVALLTQILIRSQMASRGQLGAGQRLLWSTERSVRSLRKLKKWKDRAQQRLIEDELRRIRDESSDDIEDIDVPDGPQVVEQEPEFRVR